MFTSPSKLLTIVLPESAEGQLQGDLKELGIAGYTATTSRGHGVHGDRPSRFYGDNVRIEILATTELIERVLELIDARYRPVNPLVAWVSDVQAYPAEKIAHR